MKVAACQFEVSGDIGRNHAEIQTAAISAAECGAELILFPECALTGYPPITICNSAAVDYLRLEKVMDAIEKLAEVRKICVVYGTVLKRDDGYYNGAVIQKCDGTRQIYCKRALWGWDAENFSSGSENGLFELSGLRIGVRICYEVRFPEYFRELYKEKTDLNLVLFYDTGDSPDGERYQLLRSHMCVRASENVSYCLSANTTRPFQTAPSMLADPAGKVLGELVPGIPDILLYDIDFPPPDFSRQGRKTVSDRLTGT